MPYKAVSNKVYVLRGTTWVLFNVQDSQKKAQAQAAALNIRVAAKERRRGR